MCSSRRHEESVSSCRRFARTHAFGQHDVGEDVPLGTSSGHHMNGCHWVCLSTVGCPPDTIHIYDSQNNTDISPILQKRLASLIQPASHSLTVEVMASQAQEGCSDCGLFAVAHAVALSSGQAPSSTHWDQDRMRPHLVACLQAGAFKPFPGKPMSAKEKILSTVNIPGFCHCRHQMIDQAKKIAKCRLCQEWFHAKCDDIPKAV